MKGINKPNIVSSFKMNKLTDYIEKELEQIEKIIHEEQQSMGHDRKERTTTSFEQSKAIL